MIKDNELKIFQLIVELPNISANQKRTYWNSLLNIAAEADSKITKEEIKNIKQTVENAASNKAKIRLADESNSYGHQQATREAIISSISIVEEDQRTEHQLQKFIDLIEPNPRTMKRLINDISTAKAISFLYKENIAEKISQYASSRLMQR